ncbi:MAG: GAF domain-containing protein [Scytolyngbya sp. HA4215-MV1]|jgi:PAS domain S-box-containing protein|nr:GAF domain-containing protein [Scytolyngbya sp. HA4215-MV1]
MTDFPQPANESARVSALRSYQILDTTPEEAFDDLTRLAAQICATPIALVSLVDSTRQWFKSRVGLDATETCREVAFCNYTICQSEVFVVSNALIDQRFAHNPLVVGEPHIRFYAGTPLLSPDGFSLGSLCVIDRIPRSLNQEQTDALQVLGRQVVTQLELRRNLACLAYAMDEQQRTEAALRYSEEQFRQLAEHIQEVFWIRSAENNHILYISPAYEKIWGRSRRSLYAQPNSWVDAVLPAYRGHILDCIELQQPYDKEYPIRRLDSTIRWVRDRAFPIQNEAGDVYRIVGMAEDITQRKQIELELDLVQGMAQAIFESNDFHSALRVALQKVCEVTHWDFGEAWVPRADWSVLECSPAWYSKTDRLNTFREQSQQFSFAPGEGIPGRIWISKQPAWCRDVSAMTNAHYLRAQMAQEAGLKAALGIPLLAKDEVITVLVFYMFEARQEDSRLMELISASTELGLFIQRKQAEEEIRQSLDKERELNQLKSNFISMVSHEFRTPLSSIIMSAELLEKYEQQQTSEKRQIYFKRINRATHRMTQLIEEVLLISQGEQGKLRFQPTPIDLKQFCDELVAEFQTQIGQDESLVFICEGDLTQAYVDTNLLHHILNNLLSNAIKYSPQGSFVKLELLRQVNSVVLRVKDSGIGIPLADQSHLFEFFHRAKNVSTIPGTGLGLAIVKQCVDLHGGEISVESKVGVGTVFTVKLPIELLKGEM